MSSDIQKSYADLLREITQNAKELVASEINLVKTEARSVYKNIIGHSVALSIGIWLVVFGPPFLLGSAVMVLGEQLDGRYWLSALIIGFTATLLGTVSLWIAAKRIANSHTSLQVTKKSIDRISKRTKDDVEDLSLALKGGANGI